MSADSKSQRYHLTSVDYVEIVGRSRLPVAGQPFDVVLRAFIEVSQRAGGYDG